MKYINTDIIVFLTQGVPRKPPKCQKIISQCPKKKKIICFLLITSNNKSTLWFVQNKMAKIKLTTLFLWVMQSIEIKELLNLK